MDKTAMLQVVKQIQYRNWSLRFREDEHRADALYLQWAFMSANVKTNAMEWQSGRKWYLSNWMTESELVLTAFKAALTCEEHECREKFEYCAKRIMNPHIDVKALMEVCDREDVRP